MSSGLLASRSAFIDVETTGANPVVDRITEIAILRVEQGEVVERWSSLVNPGMPIPQPIQNLVGITDAMVADAPAFSDVAAQLRRLLADCVFVAHNARFDYGFIKNEFQRLGESFDAPVLCTVKLSRALYPQHHRHGLDALIQRHGLVCSARHRALGDAEALLQFAGIASGAFAQDVLDTAIAKAMKPPSRPAGLPEGVLEGIPESPGIYLFHGEDDRPLYVGRSLNLRSRVMGHFSSDNRNSKDARIIRDVRRVNWRVTAGELGALLLEARLLRELKPAGNRRLEDADGAFALRYDPSRKHGPVLLRERLEGHDPFEAPPLYGAFRSRKEADNALREFANLYHLCPRRLGTEAWGEGPCLAHGAKRCAGVCAGKESAAAHDERLLKVLESLRLRRWPWNGPVVVHEGQPDGLQAFHLLDAWCLLGTTGDAPGLATLMAEPPPRSFDLDIYRILSRWLDTPAGKAAVSVVAGVLRQA